MTLLYYNARFLEHDTGDHPESADRLVKAARELNLFAMHIGCPRPTWEPAAWEDLVRVHPAEHLTRLQRLCTSGGGHIDDDTVVSRESFDVSRFACGAALNAVDQVLNSAEKRAFCLFRPPGHHASANRAMGFCLINHAAVAAMAAIERHGINRVLIVDWDVHHGNGTQDIFWENERVGFYSLHRSPFYPGTGAADETGGGAAAGTKLNAPIEFGTPRAEIVKRFERDLEFIAAKMRPEFVVISCGFDAHRRDPVGSLGLESEDFAPLTRAVVAVADQYAGGRVVSLLEGGYNAAAVAECMDVHLNELIRGD